MKKQFAIALTAMITFACTACSGNNDAQASSSSAAVVTPSQTLAATPSVSEEPRAEPLPELKEHAEAAVASVEKFLSGEADTKDTAAEIEAIQTKLGAVKTDGESYEQQSLRVNIESEIRLIHTKLATGEVDESARQEIEDAKKGINELLGK